MDYEKLASDEIIKRTSENLSPRGFTAEVVNTKEEALGKIKSLIPDGASVMNGSSVTLEQIGYVDYLQSGNHSWDDLHAKVKAEPDKQKRSLLRKQSLLSDYYLGSVHAVTEEGELVFSSNTGSQLSHLVFTSQNLILVVSTKKIVPSLVPAFKRIDEHIVPLEEKHMQELYGVGTQSSKTVILHKESTTSKRKVLILFVKEGLGF
jgi:L-lactate utilization protein LutB